MWDVGEPSLRSLPSLPLHLPPPFSNPYSPYLLYSPAQGTFHITPHAEETCTYYLTISTYPPPFLGLNLKNE